MQKTKHVKKLATTKKDFDEDETTKAREEEEEEEEEEDDDDVPVKSRRKQQQAMMLGDDEEKSVAFFETNGAKISESRGTDSKIRQRRVDTGRRRRSETRGGYLQGEELEEDWCVRAERERERERESV